MDDLRSLTRTIRERPFFLAAAVFIGALGIYVATLAPGTIFGDPAEYQFIPAIWGIAHPPGYAFYTLLAGVWQRVVIVGSVAYRTNLLAAFAGGWIATRVVAMILMLLQSGEPRPSSRRWEAIAALVGGGAVALAPDLWQQSIHANAHIISAAITATQLWVLMRWDKTGRDRCLYALAFLVALGVTQHPITIWGVPAYGLFIFLRRPKALLHLRRLALGFVSGVLGLSPWLYFPLRSANVPFGPTDMGTWSGFLRHATAQGLRVNLFHFGIADQADRLSVFYSLLKLQYGWLLMALILLGLIRMAVTRPRVAILWAGFLFGHLAFTMNTVQDVMAYLLHPFAALGVPLGLGVISVVESVPRRRDWLQRGAVAAVVVVLFARGIYLFPRISLHNWHDADNFVSMLQEQFQGQGEGGALVSDWEHLTPYFYHSYVDGETFAAPDLRPIYVTGDTPWVDSVFQNLPSGPVYLTNYRRDVRELGFRVGVADPSASCLQGDLWQVTDPDATSPRPPQYQLPETWVDGRLQLLGYDLPQTAVAQGGVVPVVLYARVPATETEVLMPYAVIGGGQNDPDAADGVTQEWTTDSRRLTPSWHPGEVIAECYEVFVPYNLAPGDYPLRLGYRQLTGTARQLSFSQPSSPTEAELSLGKLEVVPGSWAASAEKVVGKSLANVGNDVALRDATAWAGLSVRRSTWQKPLPIRAGQALHLRLAWKVLSEPRASYTVFIHLIDAQGQPWLVHDYTPLGGAYPSYLWFPKWLEGQRMVDPYRLVLPADLPAGTYWLEVGMYEMGGIRRIPQLTSSGMMAGDRFILGPVEVTSDVPAG